MKAVIDPHPEIPEVPPENPDVIPKEDAFLTALHQVSLPGEGL